MDSKKVIAAGAIIAGALIAALSLAPEPEVELRPLEVRPVSVGHDDGDTDRDAELERYCPYLGRVLEVGETCE
jgi:hypothetical protein